MGQILKKFLAKIDITFSSKCIQNFNSVGQIREFLHVTREGTLRAFSPTRSTRKIALFINSDTAYCLLLDKEMKKMPSP